ncbi:hypothetical protein [Halomonas sp. LBP4]|uniref:hypothetical protein n=1 Tax=Halomonas sp. LBP4 TaxID=2044917 RepID=UPI000D7521CA|nr:hypothetical protein [Halomonas sp. LBP4]PXX95857.1 hypothetical protein CR157_16795 [Halomonas sp. LBP4]
MTATYLSDLEWMGIDAFSRPVWKSVTDRQCYCLVDMLVDDTPEAQQLALQALINDPFIELYNKGSSVEGEPSHPVPFRQRPSGLRCIFAPAGQEMFVAGEQYATLPASHAGDGSHDPRCVAFRDSLGALKSIRLEPGLPKSCRTGVQASGGRSLALFEEVRDDR